MDFLKHISEHARCLADRSDWLLSQEKWKLKLQFVDIYFRIGRDMFIHNPSAQNILQCLV